MGTAMRAKKLVILLAVLLVVGLGLFGWFRPREVVLRKIAACELP